MSNLVVYQIFLALIAIFSGFIHDFSASVYHVYLIKEYMSFLLENLEHLNLIIENVESLHSVGLFLLVWMYLRYNS